LIATFHLVGITEMLGCVPQLTVSIHKGESEPSSEAL
jgi:hypothetical protein